MLMPRLSPGSLWISTSWGSPHELAAVGGGDVYCDVTMAGASTEELVSGKCDWGEVGDRVTASTCSSCGRAGRRLEGVEALEVDLPPSTLLGDCWPEDWLVVLGWERLELKEHSKTISLTPNNAEIFCINHENQMVPFQIEIINILISSSRFILIPMLWGYSHY